MPLGPYVRVRDVSVAVMDKDKAVSLYKFKRGTNPGYESLKERRERERKQLIKQGLLEVKKSKPHQFRGFIAGSYFRTSLGFQGNSFDALWGKHIFASFQQDDVELFEIAMKSELADIKVQVEGGVFGSPFQIGDMGFYADSEFSKRGDKIRNHERDYAQGTYFLSKEEWKDVDDKIQKLVSVSPPLVERAVLGDTFGAIALRMNAYKVAKRMIEFGLDPLVENVEGEDLSSIVREQYAHLTGLMHDLLTEKEASKHRVMVPSEQRDLDAREESRLNDFRHMKLFVTEFLGTMKTRLKNIHDDKAAKRRMEIKKEKVTEEMLWNISNEAKCAEHVHEMQNLLKQLTSRIATYEQQQRDHTHLSDIMFMQHKVVERKGFQVQKKMWSYEDDLAEAEEERSKASGKAPLAIQDAEPEVLPLPEGGDEDDSEVHRAFIEAQKRAEHQEREMLKKMHGVETLAEKEERIRKKKEEEEEAQLMAMSLEKEKEEAEAKKKKEKLLRETFEPTLGTLRSTKNDDGIVVEHVQYR